MQKAYNRINWENYPSDKTAVNETNLNKMDAATDEIDNRVLGLDTTKFDKTEAQTLIKNVTFDLQTGILTKYYYNGSAEEINTGLSKLNLDLRFDRETQTLYIINADGTEDPVDLSVFITNYEFDDSETIAHNVSGGRVSSVVKEGSIEEKHLQPNYLADIKVEAAKAQASQAAAATSEANALASENAAKVSEINAKTSETNAKASETSAASSAGTATTQAAAAKNSAAAASASATNAATSESTASTKAAESANSATNAASSASTATSKASAASTSAANAANSATAAESYAHGGTNSRENEDVDNAQYYYEQARRISEGLQGSLLPMGTITFSQLAQQSPLAGYMYNISNSFITDSTFKEGEGYTYPAGTNVYYTADGYWDCFAGTMVTSVNGEKGDVSVTPANIGAEPQIMGYYGSNDADTDGWYKVCTVEQGETTDTVLNLLVTQTFGRMATGVLHLHMRREYDNVLRIKKFAWMYRMGFSVEDVKIATADNTWSLYVRQTVSRWGRIQVKVLSKAATNGDLDFSLSSNKLKEASEPDGTYAEDGAIVYHAKTALKAEQDAEGNALADTYQTKTGDTGDNTVSFTSGDAAEPAGWADIDLLASGEKHSSLLRKLSLAVKNVRYMRKLLGSTDISSFGGDGTVTGVLGAFKTVIGIEQISLSAVRSVLLANMCDSSIYFKTYTGDALGLESGNYKVMAVRDFGESEGYDFAVGYSDSSAGRIYCRNWVDGVPGGWQQLVPGATKLITDDKLAITPDANAFANAPIVINSNGINDPGKAPGIGFHRAGYTGGFLYLHSDAELHWIQNSGDDWRIQKSKQPSTAEGNAGINTSYLKASSDIHYKTIYDICYVRCTLDLTQDIPENETIEIATGLPVEAINWLQMEISHIGHVGIFQINSGRLIAQAGYGKAGDIFYFTFSYPIA